MSTIFSKLQITFYSTFSFCLLCSLGILQSICIWAAVWLRAVYIFLPSKTTSSICWTGWTTASCSGNHPFSSASSKACLYFTYSWSSRMWPKMNTRADNKSLSQVESLVHFTVGDKSIYLAVWPPQAFCSDRLVVQIYQGKKYKPYLYSWYTPRKQNIYLVFTHMFNNQDLQETQLMLST